MCITVKQSMSLSYVVYCYQMTIILFYKTIAVVKMLLYGG